MGDELVSLGKGGLLEDPRRVRSDMRMIRAYLKAGVFSDEQIDRMLRRIGDIVIDGDNRESVAAFKTLLSQAKLAFDIDKHTEPEVHGHVHINADAGSGGLAELASSLGLSLRIGEDGGEDTAQGTIDGGTGARTGTSDPKRGE